MISLLVPCLDAAWLSWPLLLPPALAWPVSEDTCAGPASEDVRPTEAVEGPLEAMGPINEDEGGDIGCRDNIFTSSSTSITTDLM